MNLQLTSHIDLTLVLLYAFWVFFAGLVYYLHREGKREGYPLVADASSRGRVVPQEDPVGPKTFRMLDGSTLTLKGGRPDMREVLAAPVGPWPGAPLEPTGNGMVDGIGPGAYAERADHTDNTVEGAPKIVPLRADTSFFLASRDPDPRGMVVKGGDGEIAGEISDVWVDRSEYIVRYYEVALTGGRRVLMPSNFAAIDKARREITVKAIYGSQFAGVPATKSPDQVTLLEEDKIMGYYGGGFFYAAPQRAEPLL